LRVYNAESFGVMSIVTKSPAWPDWGRSYDAEVKIQFTLFNNKRVALRVWRDAVPNDLPCDARLQSHSFCSFGVCGQWFR
jgi:hypothetical protein